MNQEVKLKRYDPCNFCGGEYPCNMPPAHDGIYAYYDEAKEMLDAQAANIADLERQLAEATTWRSPETAPRDGTWFIGYYDTDKILGTRADTMCDKDDQYLWLTNEGFLVKRKTLIGWLPLPETKKEDV